MDRVTPLLADAFRREEEGEPVPGGADILVETAPVSAEILGSGPVQRASRAEVEQDIRDQILRMDQADLRGYGGRRDGEERRDGEGRKAGEGRVYFGQRVPRPNHPPPSKTLRKPSLSSI